MVALARLGGPSGGLVRAACGAESPGARIIHASVDQHVHNGWSMDHLGLAPVDLRVLCEPDVFVAGLLGEPALATPAARRTDDGGLGTMPRAAAPASGSIDIRMLAAALRESLGKHPRSGRRPAPGLPGAHNRSAGPETSGRSTIPLDLLGYDGVPVSARGRVWPSVPRWRCGARAACPFAVLGDGDFIMGVSAVWTAVHYQIPVLIVIANNGSFFNDEMHQERVARQRNRPDREPVDRATHRRARHRSCRDGARPGRDRHRGRFAPRHS